MTELIWERKYDNNGHKNAPIRVQLPFQTVETVNESVEKPLGTAFYRPVPNLGGGAICRKTKFSDSHNESYQEYPRLIGRKSPKESINPDETIGTS